MYFLNNVFFSLWYCKNTVCNIYNVQSLCSSTIYGISRVLIVKFWESQKLHVDFRLCRGVSTSNRHVVEISTLIETDSK